MFKEGFIEGVTVAMSHPVLSYCGLLYIICITLFVYKTLKKIYVVKTKHIENLSNGMVKLAQSKVCK